ncbi:HNH endonuclease [Shimia sp. CNT1-13L.2]|uniref:HNH endonuclease n=1 Tax=Shimia sp. CNT1-13L.2 TaxID=2959663 RepID=UPI0020CBEE34|nr:HNH endonuclease signature motif containing protein [Shimia sp. CNT1-13L.2]MCP9481663.1 HNH endonuclease [Shimia sp. CNT1-13L.2]
MGKNRYIPLGVRRQLRQEACFGCASCGNPILEYHHIIPWSEKKHNDPDHMVALCGTCHTKFGKLRRNRAYELKENPFNRIKGKIYGELGTDKAVTKLRVGSTTFENTPTVFSFFEAPLIQFRIEDGQLLLSAYIPAEDMWPSILIKDNDLLVNTENMWDVSFATNVLTVQKKERETYFSVDMRNEDVVSVFGKFSILGNDYKFTPKNTDFEGINLQDATVRNSPVAIYRGDQKNRLLWPNYAMHSPKAKFFPLKLSSEVAWERAFQAWRQNNAGWLGRRA